MRTNNLTTLNNKSLCNVLCCILAILLFSMPLPSWSGLTDGCPTHTYLGDDPATENIDWSEQAQGIANDGKHCRPV